MQEKYTYIFPVLELKENGTYIITTKYKTSARSLKGYLMQYPTTDAGRAFEYAINAGFLYLDKYGKQRFTRRAMRYMFNMFNRKEV